MPTCKPNRRIILQAALGLSVLGRGEARPDGASAATAPAKSAVSPSAGAAASGATASSKQGVVTNRAPLASQPFYLLPLGAIKPAGWLRRQLEIQAAGMTGWLDQTWPDVGPNSGWLGGTGESWERGPYYLDGLLPLAWLLDSVPLKLKAQRFIDWTLDHPWPNGMLGPANNDDWWPRMVMLKVLTQYHELTGDPRVIEVMTHYFVYQLKTLPERPLVTWGRFRWPDELVSILWLYNRTGDGRLLELAALLKRQGFDWQALFADYPYRGKTTKAAIGLDKPDVPGEIPNGLKDPALAVHGVNNAMALKASPVWSVISGLPQDRGAVTRHLNQLDQAHGLPIGIFAADEHLAGRSPSQGVELCAVVEAMYSLEQSLAITGDGALADRLERIAYNALPATLNDEMTAHQYDQQPNQVQCALTHGPWTTNGPESNLFGLEPHFGCCTANYHQGWPKLTASLWMASSDDGLAATVYAPCEVNTYVRGVNVKLTETTDYPFRHAINLRIEPARAVSFPLRLRVPAWASSTTVRLNGHALASKTEKGFIKIERHWQAGDRVDLVFDTAAQAVEGFAGSVSVEQGPLVFSLPIEENWQKLRDRGLTADWQVLPTSKWQYAMQSGASFQRVDKPIGSTPFSRHEPPVTLTVDKAVPIDWPLAEGAAAPPPANPTQQGPVQALILMPYGAPKLRITSFPRA